MTVVDFILIVFLVFFLVQGFWKGIVKEVFSLLALCLGLIAAANFYHLAAYQIDGFLGIAAVADVLGFLLVYLVVWLLIKTMGWSMGSSRNGIKANTLSRLSGGMLGLAKGLIIASLMVALAETNFPQNKITGPNYSTPTLLALAEWGRNNAPFLPEN